MTIADIPSYGAEGLPDERVIGFASCRLDGPAEEQSRNAEEAPFDIAGRACGTAAQGWGEGGEYCAQAGHFQ